MNIPQIIADTQYISVEHPNQKKLRGEVYFDNIVIPAKDWATKSQKGT